MTKIEFVEVKSEPIGFGMGKGMKYQFVGIEKIIKKKVEEGWKYKGYIPVVTRGTGDIETMSLIFEKEQQPSYE